MTDTSANQPMRGQPNTLTTVTTFAPAATAPAAPTQPTASADGTTTNGVVERLAVAAGALAGRVSGWGERIQPKYRLFQTAAVVVPRAPFWLARSATVGGALVGWALAGGMRRRVAANLRHIPALAADPQALRRATRGVFVASALNYFDFFRGQSLSDPQAMAPWLREDGRMAVDGLDLIARLLEQGRGLVVLSAHLGDFEAAATCLGALGYSTIVPAERLTPAPFMKLVVRLRRHHNVRMVPGDSRETLREMISELKRNGIVLFAVDRYVMGASARFPLFGAPARLPTTPVSFALRHNAPVVFLTSWREGPRRSHAICVPLDLATPDTATGVPGQLHTVSPVDQIGDHTDPVQQAMAVAIATLERQIAAHPDQWLSALSRVWDDDGVAHERYS